MDIIYTFFTECVNLWLEMAPYLLFGMSVAGLLHVFLGKEIISRHLGEGGIKSVVKATLLGVPLPICSCGVIPVAGSLEKEGAHKSSILAFLVATPTTGVDSIFATYSLLGPLFAIFRPLAAMVCGISLGVADYFIEGKNEKEKVRHPHDHPKVKVSFKWREFLKYSFVEVPQDIGKALILGIMIAGAIAAFVPVSVFEKFFFFPFDFIAALLIGIPLYVCSTGSIPVAVSLIMKGFSPGAGLVFLITGPATNAVTLSFVRAKLGKKSFYLYLINIIAVSVLMGLLFNYIWFLQGGNSLFTIGAGKMLDQKIKIAAGIILLGLIVNTFFNNKSCNLNVQADKEISVPDIHCKHCKIALEGTLHDVEGVNKVVVDIDLKVVKIFGSANLGEILEKIRKAGYNPKT
ncbi:MAG: permease [Candidatus Omnitrophica bacterium]|nr:permease [Candidatus Omnitrophota bacterium]